MIPGYPQIGDIIADKYRIERRLGGGGMGTVFSATHLMTGRRFALKWMNTRAAYDNAARERFIREFQVAGSIMHPNVAAVLDVGSREGALYIVMEYLEGESLAARIARGGPMAPADCVPIVVEAMRGVGAAHRLDIVHRDLKPDNIFICASPGRSGYDVKVLDFGVMKPVNERAEQMPTITARGMAVGTPPYMAPEQVLALPSMDHRIDVYAFGVILYEALSARLPYADVKGMQLLERIVRGGPPALSRVAMGVPIGLEATVMRALQKDPRRRFASLEDFAACLQPWAASASSFADLPRRDARTTTPPGGSVAPNDAGAYRASVPDAQSARASKPATPPPLPSRRAITSEPAAVPERASVPTLAPPPAVAAVFRLSKMPSNEMPRASQTPSPDLREEALATSGESPAMLSEKAASEQATRIESVEPVDGRLAMRVDASHAHAHAEADSGRAASGEFVNGQRSSAEPSASSGTSSRIPRRSRVPTLTPSVAPPAPILPLVPPPATRQPAAASVSSAARARSVGSPPWTHPRAVAGLKALPLSMEALTDALDSDGAELEGVPFADRVTQPIRVAESQPFALNVEAAPQSPPPSAAIRNWQNGPSQDIWSIPTEFMQAPTPRKAIRSRTILTLVAVAAGVGLSVASTQWNRADSTADAEIDEGIFASAPNDDDSLFAPANQADVPAADELAPMRDIFAPSPDDPPSTQDVYAPSHNPAPRSADIFAPSHDEVVSSADAIAPAHDHVPPTADVLEREPAAQTSANAALAPVPTPALEGVELKPEIEVPAADSAHEAAAASASVAPAAKPSTPVKDPTKASTPASTRKVQAPDAPRTTGHPDDAREATREVPASTAQTPSPALAAAPSAAPHASPAPDGTAIKAPISGSGGDAHAASPAPKTDPALAPLALAKPEPAVQVSPLELGPAAVQPPLAPVDDSPAGALSPLNLTPATPAIAPPAPTPNSATGRAQLGPSALPVAEPALAGAEATAAEPTSAATADLVRPDAAPASPAPSDSARVKPGQNDSAHVGQSPSPTPPGRAQAERSADTAAASGPGTAAPPRRDAAAEAAAPRVTPDATRSEPARANSASSDPSIATGADSDSARSHGPRADSAPSPGSATPPGARVEPSSAAAAIRATTPPPRADSASGAPGADNSARAEPLRAAAPHSNTPSARIALADPGTARSTPSPAATAPHAEQSSAAATTRANTNAPRSDSTREPPAPRSAADAERAEPPPANSPRSNTPPTWLADPGAARSAPSPVATASPAPSEQPSAARTKADTQRSDAVADAPAPRAAADAERSNTSPAPATTPAGETLDSSRSEPSSTATRAPAPEAARPQSANSDASDTPTARARSEAARSETAPGSRAHDVADPARSKAAPAPPKNRTAADARDPKPSAPPLAAGAGPRATRANDARATDLKQPSPKPAASAPKNAAHARAETARETPAAGTPKNAARGKAEPARETPTARAATNSARAKTERVRETPAAAASNPARAKPEPARKAPAAGASTNTTRAKAEPARPNKAPAVTREAPPAPDSPAAISGNDTAPNSATPARKTSGVSLTDF